MKSDRSRDVNRMRSQLGRKILALLMCMASLISSRPLLSQDASKWWLGSAVDAHGVRHYGSEYRKQGRKKAPWMEDRIYAPRLQYPYEARARHIAGSGLFRLTLDLSTGSVCDANSAGSTFTRRDPDSASAMTGLHPIDQSRPPYQF
jgi:hypothetical protein